MARVEFGQSLVEGSSSKAGVLYSKSIVRSFQLNFGLERGTQFAPRLDALPIRRNENKIFPKGH